MRKYVTAAATAFTLGFLVLATPAMADQYQVYGNQGQQGHYQPGQNQSGPYQSDRYQSGQYQGNQSQGYGDAYQPAGHAGGDGWRDPSTSDDRGRGDGWRHRDQTYDWGRQEGNFDRWEHGWNRGGWDNDRHAVALPYWRLVRRLEQQGYYGVRGLRPSRFGFGWRAFAFVGRGQPVMLRINPYTGRVLDVRYI